ncbi:hypothetical protein U1Q18_000591 [Sarracenia purpurea var. burkii]
MSKQTSQARPDDPTGQVGHIDESSDPDQPLLHPIAAIKGTKSGSTNPTTESKSWDLSDFTSHNPRGCGESDGRKEKKDLQRNRLEAQRTVGYEDRDGWISASPLYPAFRPPDDAPL